ncbi:MAG: DUF2188 domain-containing protein [Acidobacteriota bacterium]|jgi:hypothetical protein
MSRVLQVFRVTPTEDGWLLRADGGAAPQQKFSSKDDAISAGVRLALAGGYLLVSHSDGTVEKVFPFCRQ